MITSFNKEKHEYLIDGKKATGVTTIIGVLAKPALIGWAAKMTTGWIKENCEVEVEHGRYMVSLDELELAQGAHNRRKEEAGSHGTDTHALVEEWINNCLKAGLEGVEGAPLPFGFSAGTDDYYKPIAPFITWATENVDHFLFSERQMFNKELFIAGTADFAYVGKDGKRYMADFKTSSGIYGIDYWLQVAAYRLLAEAEGDEPYDGATVVRMGKKGPSDFEVLHRYDYETDKEAFMACLTLYRAQATFKKPKY